MVGVKGRSGRRGKITEEEFLAGKRPGTPSWPKHPTAVAGTHLLSLMEIWLATSIEESHTVPPKVMRVMALAAIRHVIQVYDCHALWESDAVVSLDVAEVIAWAHRRAPDNTLRRKKRFLRQ
jgi:hypothetical protein